nr:hypothetical protein [Crucivirus sp.]
MQTTQILTSTTQWSNADLKAPNALIVVLAQGALSLVIPIQLTMQLVFGTNVFTNAPTLTVHYTTGVLNVITPSASFWQAGNNQIYQTTFFGGDNQESTITNKNTTLQLSTGLTGNAGNDNVVNVVFRYYVITFNV